MQGIGGDSLRESATSSGGWGIVARIMQGTKGFSFEGRWPLQERRGGKRPLERSPRSWKTLRWLGLWWGRSCMAGHARVMVLFAFHLLIGMVHLPSGVSPATVGRLFPIGVATWQPQMNRFAHIENH